MTNLQLRCPVAHHAQGHHQQRRPGPAGGRRQGGGRAGVGRGGVRHRLAGGRGPGRRLALRGLCCLGRFGRLGHLGRLGGGRLGGFGGGLGLGLGLCGGGLALALFGPGPRPLIFRPIPITPLPILVLLAVRRSRRASPLFLRARRPDCPSAATRPPNLRLLLLLLLLCVHSGPGCRFEPLVACWGLCWRCWRCCCWRCCCCCCWCCCCTAPTSCCTAPSSAAGVHPLVERGVGRPRAVGGDEAEDGEGLAQTHVISQDAAPYRRRPLARGRVGEGVYVLDGAAGGDVALPAKNGDERDAKFDVMSPRPSTTRQSDAPYAPSPSPGPNPPRTKTAAAPRSSPAGSSTPAPPSGAGRGQTGSQGRGRRGPGWRGARPWRGALQGAGGKIEGRRGHWWGCCEG
jgi:hypothetical protein